LVIESNQIVGFVNLHKSFRRADPMIDIVDLAKGLLNKTPLLCRFYQRDLPLERGRALQKDIDVE